MEGFNDDAIVVVVLVSALRLEAAASTPANTIRTKEMRGFFMPALISNDFRSSGLRL
jgi:hypothetical protein